MTARAFRSTCPACGYIHSSNDARAVGRLTETPTYAAANALTPARQTRAEAEADECRWRQSRPSPPIPKVPPVPARPVVRVVESEPEPFPAERMEVAARAKAWRDFLANVHFSLMVWQIDPEVRKGEHVIHWLRECRDDLDALIAGHSARRAIDA